MTGSVMPSAARLSLGLEGQALREALRAFYRSVRHRTEVLARPIGPEDAQVQSMTEASPTKWHLGHTSWFFETFLLREDVGYVPVHPQYEVLFNSYYSAVGPQHPRAQRGMLSRPTLGEVLDYRRWVDENVIRRLEALAPRQLAEKAGLIELGLHHEEQHQELMLTDILHLLSLNPLRPAYCEGKPSASAGAAPLKWHRYDEGIYWIGHKGHSFAFDNESPWHRRFLHGFELASRLVTAGEYMEFLGDGGYERPELWLSDGWAAVRERGWTSPLYWEHRDGGWWRMSLYGLVPVDPSTPVCHLSYYEADAYARWAGARLPTEAEWEVAASALPVEGNFMESGSLAALAPVERETSRPQQLFGDLWEWTQSAYSAYPGYRPPAGAVGEYNGKFMCNQMVLRGGSLATPVGHVRPSYRNFFPPDARWQFTGLRLARRASGRS